MRFNECLKKAREKTGLSQKELAEKLNIPPQMINRYENSDTEPRIGFVIDVAKVLGLSLDDLMQYKPAKINLYNDILKGLYIIKENDNNFEIIDLSIKKDGQFLAISFKDKKFFENKLDEIVQNADKEGMKLFRASVQDSIAKLFIDVMKNVLIYGNEENSTYKNINIDDINFYINSSDNLNTHSKE